MKRVSLTQYLVEQQREHGRIPGQLRLLIEVVARACKRIAISVNKGSLGDVMKESAQAAFSLVELLVDMPEDSFTASSTATNSRPDLARMINMAMLARHGLHLQEDSPAGEELLVLGCL